MERLEEYAEEESPFTEQEKLQRDCYFFNIKLALLGSLIKIITSTTIKHKRQ